MSAPKLVIRVPHGMAIFTQVTLNGQDVMATRVSFDTGADPKTGMVKAHIEFYADIDVVMEAGDIELDPKRRDMDPLKETLPA